MKNDEAPLTTPEGISKDMTIGQAAAFLGCSPGHLRDLEQNGILVPDQRTKGGHRRYSLARLQLYLKEGFSATGAVCCYGDPRSPEFERNKTRALSYCRNRSIRSVHTCSSSGSWNGGTAVLVELLGMIDGGSVRTLVLVDALSYSPDVLGTIIRMAAHRRVEVCLL